MKHKAAFRYATDLDLVQQAALDERSRHLRRLIFRAIENGGRGHIGPALSLVEIIRVLYDDFLRHDPAKPAWRERDRFGHGDGARRARAAGSSPDRAPGNGDGSRSPCDPSRNE